MVPLHASDTLTRARPSRKAGFQIDRVTEDDGLSGVNACFADWHGGAHLRDRKQHRKKNLFTRVRTHNQNMTVAAMQIAERNSSPHLS